MITHRERVDGKHMEICSAILHMGNIAGEMVRLAVESILSGDVALARHVIDMDDEVDRLEEETTRKIITAVAMQAPVAYDLRFLTSSLGVAGELEKIADDAVKLARRATKLVGHFPGEMKLALERLGVESRRSLSSALRLFMTYDEALALSIIDDDNKVDTAYVAARDAVFTLIQEDPAETSNLVRVIEAFHALEHVADHATEIASRLRMYYAQIQPMEISAHQTQLAS